MTTDLTIDMQVKETVEYHQAFSTGTLFSVCLIIQLNILLCQFQSFSIVYKTYIPLLEPENNHHPVNFPLLQHFPQTRNVSQGNKPENTNTGSPFLRTQIHNKSIDD